LNWLLSRCSRQGNRGAFGTP